MSAIGSYVRVRTADLDRCLVLAESVRPERPFRWPWQPRAETGQEVFAREWAAATLEEAVFDYSGYVLASYFLAQTELNELDDPFDSAEGKLLAKVFTAAFPARTPRTFPTLQKAALEQFCRTEWPDDGAGMAEAILAAHAFFEAGIARITDKDAVVFIIS